MTQSAFIPEKSSANLYCLHCPDYQATPSHVCKFSLEIKTEELESLHGIFMHWHALAGMIIESDCVDAENALMP